MKTKKTTRFIIVALILNYFNGSAQKLPNVQQTLLRVPANLKIDGKAAEWGNNLQAYNNATSLFYSIANDDENIYLVVKTNKPRIIDKIIDVGITFTVNPDGKKHNDEKVSRSITYPLIDYAPGQRIIWYAGAKIRLGVPVPKYLSDRDTTLYSVKRTDSLTDFANSLFIASSKTIKVSGISNITDPVISIYNEERLKAAAAFDYAGWYTFELAVPLKYLGLSVTAATPFSYNIRLESRLTAPKRGMQTHYIYPNGIMTDIDQDLDSTTDFWATYILAK